MRFTWPLGGARSKARHFFADGYIILFAFNKFLIDNTSFYLY